MLKDATRCKPVQLFVDTVSNCREKQTSSLLGSTSAYISEGTSPIPHFLKMQNGVNEVTSFGLTFTFTFTD